MNVNLIVATTQNNVIGKDNDMPWSLPNDLKNFQKVTTLGESNIVIMGRKTYDSIGRALPGRTNYVVTRNGNKEETNYIDAQVFNTIEDALEAAKGVDGFLKNLDVDVHIIGGASIYNQVMKMNVVEMIYHTLIHADIDGDTFFEVPGDWKVLSEKPFKADETHTHDYTFRVLRRNRD